MNNLAKVIALGGRRLNKALAMHYLFSEQGIPKGYIPLAYIKSTGTQYIDLGIKPSDDMEFEIEYQSLATSNTKLYGCEATSSSLFDAFGVRKTQANIRAFGNRSVTIATRAGEKNFLKLVIKDGINNVYLNGELIASPQTSGIVPKLSIFLFASNKNGNPDGRGSQIVYACRVKKSGKQVGDFRPFLNADSEAGMLNIVDMKFHPNIGTGEFEYEVKPKIYGVSWDGTSTTAFSRTDDAELFTDPVPYIAGASSYSSPFDDISPWKDMKIVEDSTAGSLVSIPKYYYKWTKTGDSMKLQISADPFEGSLVSPAHADRGDGVGERDVVYVGRYHCNSSYKSVTSSSPQAKITRATARTNIHNLGSTYWQYDFAMYWTICMLYLVEFADWNSQEKIGYGCSTNGRAMSVGYTDSMPYHTGTTASARTSYGGTQYRHIEGLWDNVYDWCDGIYFSDANIYCTKNPSSFSDSSGGTLVSTRPTSAGLIKSWNVPTTSGFEYALYPTTVGGSDSTYTPDFCNYNSSGVVLFVGGGYGQSTNLGLFCLHGFHSVSKSFSDVGCRLQKLP